MFYLLTKRCKYPHNAGYTLFHEHTCHYWKKQTYEYLRRIRFCRKSSGVGKSTNDVSEQHFDHIVKAQTHKFLKNKNQLDATYCSIVLLIDSTCFGHYYAHHQELATVMLITTLVVSFLGCCRLEVRCRLCWSSVRAAGYSTTESCYNMMMSIVVSETCWAYKKYNKTVSSI